MRSSHQPLSLGKRLRVLVSTSDTIALSFGFASTFIAIVTVFVTRRAYYVPSSHILSLPFAYDFKYGNEADIHAFTARDLERRSHSNPESGMQVHEDIIMEEVQLRRWSSLKRHKVDGDLS